MLPRPSASQNVEHVFAFKKATVEIFLIASDEAIASWEAGFAVEHSMVDEKNSGLKSLPPYFTLLGLGEQEVEHHPIPNNAKWLPLELLARQSNDLIISKPRAAKHLRGAIQHIFNQFCLHTVA